MEHNITDYKGNGRVLYHCPFLRFFTIMPHTLPYQKIKEGTLWKEHGYHFYHQLLQL